MLNARYAHTNVIARDWRRLASFYETVFGCERASPERDLKGPDLDAGTGVPGSQIRGIHLRLPGGGPNGPTLEILTYATLADGLAPAVNRPGLGHLAFAVPDVPMAREEVLAAGGRPVGDVVTLTLATGGRVTWCYVTDPEGNVIELQAWAEAQDGAEIPMTEAIRDVDAV